jgi:ribonuclease D
MSIIRIPLHAETDSLPPFHGLARHHIICPSSPAGFSEAVDDLLACACVGFDTESKPTFKVGEVSTGPHLIQFATPHRAYLFRVAVPGCIAAARAVLEAQAVVKIGFGLKSDRSRLHSKLGIQARSLLDLGSVLRHQGKKGQVGLRGAVAGVFGARIAKSRSVSTSNWARSELSEAQQAYAANDAYAALRVFLKLSGEQQQALLQLARAADNQTRAKPERTPVA